MSVAFLLALALYSLTQAPDAAAVLERARSLYTEQGPRPALPEFERALGMYRQAKDRRGEAIVLGYIGNCYKRLGEYPKALDHLHRALEAKQALGERLEEGKTHNHLGLVYWEMSAYARATSHYERSVAIAKEVRNPELEAGALNNLALVLDEQGQYRRSIEHYRRALELHRTNKDERSESYTLGNIGGWHLLLGRFREALDYYKQALEISERLNDKASLTADLGNIAVCRIGLGEVKESLATFDRALALAREAGLAKEEADWHKGKGEALLRLGRYSAALDEYRLAVQVYERAGLRQQLIEGLSNLGSLHLILGDLATGEPYFRRASALSRRIGHPRGVTANLIALGGIEWRRKRYARAAALYREALAQARRADDRGHITLGLIELAMTLRDQGRLDEMRARAQEALEVARAAGAPLLEAQALYTLGEAERARGQTEAALQNYSAGDRIAAVAGDAELGWRLGFAQGQVLEALGRDAEAVDAYRRSASTIESVRSQLREERFRAGYIEDKYQVYVALVRLLLKMGRAGDAFHFAERLRARSYADLVARGAPRLSGARELELRERIRRLQRAIEAEDSRPEQRAGAREVFSAELAEAEREYHNLLDDLRTADPGYAAGRALSVPSVEDAQKLLPAGAALVEYVVAGDGVAIFLLTSSRIEAMTVPVREADVRARVELLRDLILRQDSAEWRGPARALGRSLLDPVVQAGWLEGVRSLYIVPHGLLHYVPFAALPVRAPEGAKPLVELYGVSHLPAAASLAGRRPANRTERNLFAVAPARARLPFAREEARSVAAMFSVESRALVGARATEASFKSAASGFRMLHLATHGRFNKFNPLLSALELEPDRQEDGRLEVHEVMGMRLDADLVTLSACETALGSGYFAEVPAGDDFVGLTRAFLGTGSDSVLASLWEVNDRSTLDFMRSFYRNLAKAGKADALAQAQRAMLHRGGRYAHPYFWAPFVLVGAME